MSRSNAHDGLLIRWLTLTAAIIASSYMIDGIGVSGFFFLHQILL